MRSKLTVLLAICILIGCIKSKRLTNDELEDKLKTTMQNYLYADKKTDSSKVRYEITEVTYFDDSLQDKYLCEFKVHMFVKANNFDTTGIMKANISRDFKKVDRLD